MTELKVTYFDFAGSRGEELRLALTIARVAFVDNRVDGKTFEALKPGLPFPILPVFEVNGRPPMSQTNAILRLIGRQHGMHPEDLFEAARHDELMDAVEDLRHRISPSMRMKDAEEKSAARKQLADGYIPHWGRGVENLIGAGPFVGGARPSVADIKLYMAHKWISSGSVDDIPPGIFDPFPKLNAVAVNIRTLPAVVAWYAG